MAWYWWVAIVVVVITLSVVFGPGKVFLEAVGEIVEAVFSSIFD